ncbi:MAG TPA: TIM-barrel domain-containing protein [Gemmatimonadales bacterium]|nr:TIM-barrel domain-containing protein [Gemmatimonadales bacterium]
MGRLSTSWYRARRLAFVIAPVCAAGALAGPAARSWTSLGDMPAGRPIPQGVEYRNRQAAVRLTVVAPGVIRVRFSPVPAFGRDHSYAVAPAGARAADAQFTPGAERDRLRTAGTVLEIQRTPFRLRFVDESGAPRDEDYAPDGMASDGPRVRVWKALRDDDHFYGLGEKTGPLDKRGMKLGGTAAVMWNSDVFGYDNSTDPLYDDIPFFMVLRDGRAHGIFFDNTYRSTFDIGKESRAYYDFGAEGGELDYYFLAGPRPADVLARYADLTGHMPLPPLWALGYHQCRYSYYPESKVRAIAREFRERRIPADALWFDIHYMQDYRVFTWNHERFPAPEQLLADLNHAGFATVAIVDPGVKQDPGYAVYDDGVAHDVFVHRPNGSLFVGPVWPGPAVFPDFTRAASRAWWADQIARFSAPGLTGIWNDMNEPSVFNVASATMPDDVVFENEGQPSTHAEDHNVYGQQMSRATRDGLLQLRPHERPFVLTRATYAGGQRYAAVWTGDNSADWEHLRDGITTLLGMGISGYPFVGNDIGGFFGGGAPELWTRWVEPAAFFPFMRGHAALGEPPKEPWAFGEPWETHNRRAIERRYSFLPYIYNAFFEASETGMPPMRALVLEYPDDPATYNLSNEFLFGHDLLVAPVLAPGDTAREVYVPQGTWYDAEHLQEFTGRQRAVVRAPIEALPLLVRDGAILFRAPVMQTTREWATAPLTFEVFAKSATTRSYYEDDGTYEGTSSVRDVRYTPDNAGATLQLSAARGAYQPRHQDDVAVIHFARRPHSVVWRSGKEERPLDTWTFDGTVQTVTIRFPQTTEAGALVLEW